MKRIFLFLIACLCLNLAALGQKSTISLNENWKFKQEGKVESYPAQIPGTIHTDLLNSKLIPDPFFGENEQQVQWVEKQTWIYETVFNVPANELAKENIELVFEGLDTYAQVYLNDQKILESANMFRTWKIPVKGLLQTKNNRLKVVFEPVNPKAKALASQLAYPLPGEEKVFIRKAQYQFGWDWGPRLVTCGIWKPVKLVCWDNNQLAHVQVVQQSLNQDWAELDVQCRLSSSATKSLNLEASLCDSNIKIAGKGLIKPGDTTAVLHLKLKSPQLWWSNGLGQAHLYQLAVKLSANDQLLDSYQTDIGLRTIELVQAKDSLGSGFYVKLNGVPVFMKGANIIPTDSFTPRSGYAVYENLVKEAKDSHMNMLRVWGGGVYGDDDFYRLCDQNGILVWQDLMFAGSPYPADSDFLNNVAQEIKDQVIRLRNHPSLAIWCGNNEISEGWFNWGWQKQYQYSKTDSAKIKQDYDYTFEKFIPSLLKQLDPQRFYHPSSPANGWGRPKSYREADVHYWGVWWGMEPFENYEKKVGRFVSEYGFQAMPEFNSLQKHLAPEDLYLISPALKNHQKHSRGFETISSYMEQDYPIPTKLEDYSYLSQLLQARGLKTAIEAHRRAKPYCMGSLYWQLNDCWPVSSWSTVDYYGMPKAAHYQLKSLYNDLLISVGGGPEDYQIYLISDVLKPIKAILKIEVLDFDGQVRYQQRIPVEMPANSSEIYARINTKDWQNFDPKNSVLYCQLLSGDEKLAEHQYYFVKDKKLKLPNAKLEIKEISKHTYSVKSDQLAKGVFLSLEGQVADQNYFDLMPGIPKIVRFKPLNDSKQKSGLPNVKTLNELLERLKN